MKKLFFLFVVSTASLLKANTASTEEYVKVAVAPCSVHVTFYNQFGIAVNQFTYVSEQSSEFGCNVYAFGLMNRLREQGYNVSSFTPAKEALVAS